MSLILGIISIILLIVNMIVSSIYLPLTPVQVFTWIMPVALKVYDRIEHYQKEVAPNRRGSDSRF